MSYRLKVVTLWIAIAATISCEPGTQPAVVQDPPPNAPSGLSATASSPAVVSLSWTDASTNEQQFAIERCAGVGCANFAPLATAPANTTGYADINGVTANVSYSYRVRASNAAGASAFSNTATALTPQALPAAPSGLVATAMSSSSIVVTWTDNASNENGFTVERCQGAACTNFAAIGGTSASSTIYMDNGLTAATTYRYRVKAYGAGESAYAGPVAATTNVALAAPPTGLLATAVSTSQINLSWVDASTNETAFKIDRCTGAGCTTFAEIASLAAGVTSYQNTGLAATTTYGYRVRAFNTAGSTPSGTATATTFAPSPLIVLSPTSRSFSGTAGGAAPASQAVQVSNGGGGTLNGLSRTIAYQAGQTTSWLTASLSGTIAPVTLTLTANPTTLAAGTYNATVSIHSTAASNTPRTVTVTFTVAPGTPTTPTTLRIVNDLPGGIIGGGNWTQLNTVIRVRIGPTSASVINFTAQARELLFNGDQTSDGNQTFQITPGTQANLNVSSQTGTYWVYIQTGWWEFFTETLLWVKHPAQVMACDGQQLAYKWVAFPVTAPFGAPEIIRLSEFMPAGSYGPPFCP